MRWMKIIGLMTVVMAISGAISGCIIHEEDDDYCYDCGAPPPPPLPVEEWVDLGYWNTLEVGGFCGCGDPCTAPCAYVEEDVSYDTLYLDGYWDYNMMDLRFSYVLTNWSNRTTSTWVTLCDDLGCEDVWYDNIYPYEEIWDSPFNPVLDTALSGFDDCIYQCGEACNFTYYIDVYLGEECTCAPLTLDYTYQGLYVY